MRNVPRSHYVVPMSLAGLALMLLIPVAVGAAAGHPSPPARTCRPFTEFMASDFGRSTKIDNRFLPLVPGTQLSLEGRANTGGAALPHTVVFTVTDLVKQIDGVYSLVVWDVDISDGQKAEAELAFFAQDKAGNVWNLGEYPEEYEQGKFVGAPNTWISGQRAVGGVHMPANPQLGKPAYLQGFAPRIDFLDCAQVFAMGERVCVPVTCFDNVLVTDETSPLADPGAHQRKHHAPGVGIVQIGAVDDPEGETLVLIKLKHLGPHALAEAREEALKLDRHAYQVSEVYRQTPPAVPCVPIRPATLLPPGLIGSLSCP
jgi:hypothetical protein